MVACATGAPWRDAVTHVTIDSSASFAKGVGDGLPHAVLVVDRFHGIQLANDTITEVRQRVVREHESSRSQGRPGLAGPASPAHAHEHLRPETFERMWNALIDTGDPGIEIRGAYIVKEDLRSQFALAGTLADRPQITRRLTTFYDQQQASISAEVHRLATTVDR